VSLPQSSATEQAPALHSVSVSAAVLDERGRFLVIQRSDNGRWEPPGGVLELGESIHDGLAREVEEETGLRVEPQALTGVYKNMQRAIVALVFRCRVVGGQPRAGAECCRLSWVDADELASLMADAYAVRLTDALDPGSPRVRAHDGEHVLDSASPGLRT
jgi:8-oxo-dGTP diphosphatase